MNKLKDIEYSGHLKAGELYILLIDWQNQQNNRILFSTSTHASDLLGNFDWKDYLSKENMLVDYADLYGKGCELSILSYEGETDESESYDDEWCDCIIVKYNSKKHLFFRQQPIEEFPIIENELNAGVYRMNSSYHYWIETAADLNELLEHDGFAFEISQQKIICHPEEIEIFDFIKGCVLFVIERLPDNYFDICCPVCHKTVITHDRKVDCSILKQPCAHFVGEIAIEGISINENSIKDLPYVHRLKEGKLSIKINGSWQTAIICEAPKDSENSFWSNDDITHFVFVDVKK